MNEFKKICNGIRQRDLDISNKNIMKFLDTFYKQGNKMCYNETESERRFVFICE